MISASKWAPRSPRRKAQNSHSASDGVRPRRSACPQNLQHHRLRACRSSQEAGIARHPSPLRAAFHEQPRDRGAQIADAFATARRGEDHLRKSGGTRGDEGAGSGKALFLFGGFHFILSSSRRSDRTPPIDREESSISMSIGLAPWRPSMRRKTRASGARPRKNILDQAAPGRGLFL